MYAIRSYYAGVGPWGIEYRVDRLNALVALLVVITSYSIHYTKLYENMRLMGDKISARQTVTKTGVPILPGTKDA